MSEDIILKDQKYNVPSTVVRAWKKFIDAPTDSKHQHYKEKILKELCSSGIFGMYPTLGCTMKDVFLPKDFALFRVTFKVTPDTNISIAPIRYITFHLDKTKEHFKWEVDWLDQMGVRKKSCTLHSIQEIMDEMKIVKEGVWT